MTPYYDSAGIRLFLGSCDDVLPLLPPASFDLVVTSPPYNLGGPANPDLRRRRVERSHGASGPRWSALGTGYGDHADALPEADYRAWQLVVLTALHALVVPGGSCFYNHKIRQRDGVALHPMAWLGDGANPWTLRQEIVWDRGSTHQHDEGYFWPHDERIYWLTKGAPDLTGRRMGRSTIWRIPPLQGEEHPAPFPPGVPATAIEVTGARSVLDPFVGSGTSMLAAKLAGATGVGCDVEERFLEQAARRLDQGVLPLWQDSQVPA